MIRAAAAIGLALLAAAGAARGEDDAARIRRAVAHTISTQLPNGLFRYDFDFLAAKPSGQDNIVRQAGTLFALATYLADTGDAAVVPAIAAGLDAMAQRSLPIGTGTLQSGLERIGVFTIDSGRLRAALERGGLLYASAGSGLVVSSDGRYAGAHAGATALALIAELEYFRATRDDRFAAQREGWRHGLLALRVPGSGIRQRPTLLRTGVYVDGQVWLAMALYHQLFPGDAPAAQALYDVEDYVLRHYGEAPNPLFYHWGALGSAARLATGDAARLARFSADQAAFILDAIPPSETESATSCALIEGLSSAAAVIRSQPGREDLIARIGERVALELERNRALQIRPGQQKLALAGGGELRAPSLAASAGAFLAGPYTPYTRCDLTQHCILAMLDARKYGLVGSDPERVAAER